jgi:hypothetical protein
MTRERQPSEHCQEDRAQGRSGKAVPARPLAVSPAAAARGPGGAVTRSRATSNWPGEDQGRVQALTASAPPAWPAVLPCDWPVIVIGLGDIPDRRISDPHPRLNVSGVPADSARNGGRRDGHRLPGGGRLLRRPARCLLHQAGLAWLAARALVRGVARARPAPGGPWAWLRRACCTYCSSALSYSSAPFSWPPCGCGGDPASTRPVNSHPPPLMGGHSHFGCADTCRDGCPGWPGASPLVRRSVGMCGPRCWDSSVPGLVARVGRGG